MNKPKISMLEAISSSMKYKKMGEEARKSLIDKRLRAMVEWAKENSPFYSKLYGNLGSSWKLEDLKPVNKSMLMESWNDWVTDPSISLEACNEFMKDMDNIDRKINGKYMIFTTSGSTGKPLVSLCDNTVNNVMGAVNALRSFARKEDLKAFIKKGGKTMGVFATSGFYLGNSSVRSRLLAMPWKKKQMGVISALLPIGQIVQTLNSFQPAMLGGYPSNLELLVEEKNEGRLKIEPVLIMTGGEFLSPGLRERLSKAFHCYVQTSYSCTEAGTIACECEHQHFHINDDWVIVEAVDKDNRPVKPGQQAQKILLTNLFNFTQPYIRYEITDRVVLHNQDCPCGNPSPYLSLEGRTDDVLTLKGLKVPPLALYAVLKEVHQLIRFQIVSYREDSLELRLQGKIDRQTAFEAAKEALTEYLGTLGITGVTVVLSPEEPKEDSKSGKFKHIINKQGQ